MLEHLCKLQALSSQAKHVRIALPSTDELQDWIMAQGPSFDHQLRVNCSVIGAVPLLERSLAGLERLLRAWAEAPVTRFWSDVLFYPASWSTATDAQRPGVTFKQLMRVR